MNYYLLASGSKGNCSIFVNDENEILMIDCGISIKEIKQNKKKILIHQFSVSILQFISLFEPNTNQTLVN